MFYEVNLFGICMKPASELGFLELRAPCYSGCNYRLIDAFGEISLGG